MALIVPKFEGTRHSEDPKQALDANLIMLGDYADPDEQKAKIFEMLGPDYLSEFEPEENRVLVITYCWPQRRKVVRDDGSVTYLSLPNSMAKVNRWEGKTGLIIAIGPTAYKYYGAFKREGTRHEIGDWIWYRATDAPERGFGTSIRNMLWGRMIPDDLIEGRCKDPRNVY